MFNLRTNQKTFTDEIKKHKCTYWPLHILASFSYHWRAIIISQTLKIIDASLLGQLSCSLMKCFVADSISFTNSECVLIGKFITKKTFIKTKVMRVGRKCRFEPGYQYAGYNPENGQGFLCPSVLICFVRLLTSKLCFTNWQLLPYILKTRSLGLKTELPFLSMMKEVTVVSISGHFQG